LYVLGKRFFGEEQACSYVTKIRRYKLTAMSFKDNEAHFLAESRSIANIYLIIDGRPDSKYCGKNTTS